MSLVSVKDIQQASGLNGIGLVGKPIAWFLYRLFRIHQINLLYSKIKNYDTTTALNRLLREQNIDYELHEEDLKRIPQEGPFILVSNHPLGGLDGILMMKILHQARPDFKILANFLLHKIEPLQPIIFPVNPFEKRKDIKNSLNGMRNAYIHVKEGNCLGLFPAGEVSYKNKKGEILDPKWQASALKLIRKSNVPILPMYFHAKNSNIFYKLSRLSADLQTAMLPTELLRKRKKPIRIRIGKPIKPIQFKDFTEEEFAEFVRKKTYSLASFYQEKKGFRESLKIASHPPNKTPEKIANQVPANLIEQEIKRLKQSEEGFLFKNNHYECYFSNAQDIPNTLKELGRLREITFRKIGEGTNKPLDLDKYDQHYHHLFIWDSDKKILVGAYRMALGKEVFEKFGVNGFYTNELFNFEPELHPFFKRSIEMGRAFVVAEYQQKPMPLFLLWRGIVHITLRYPEHKYIIGGVSISNQFSDVSKSLMIEFMKSHYYDPFVAQYVRPKMEYKVKLKDSDKEFFFDEANADLNKFDKLIDELEPNILRLPVLLKKYIKQNAKVIGFNVDPKFNDAVDGLMYIRVSDIPESTVKPVLEDLQKELEKKQKNKTT